VRDLRFSHGVADYSYLLVCDAVLLGAWFPVFCRIRVSSASGLISSRRSDPEDTVLWSLDWLTLKLKVLQFSETTESIHPVTQPKDLNPNAW